jgi:hypothetical protein
MHAAVTSHTTAMQYSACTGSNIRQVVLHQFSLYRTACRSLPVHQQEVTDEQGRRRFHGAFTGGFSAGYYNTVGSKVRQQHRIGTSCAAAAAQMAAQGTATSCGSSTCRTLAFVVRVHHRSSNDWYATFTGRLQCQCKAATAAAVRSSSSSSSVIANSSM